MYHVHPIFRKLEHFFWTVYGILVYSEFSIALTPFSSGRQVYQYTRVQRFSDWLFTPKVDWYTGIPVYRDFLTAYSISDSIPVYWYTGIQGFSNSLLHF